MYVEDLVLGPGEQGHDEMDVGRDAPVEPNLDGLAREAGCGRLRRVDRSGQGIAVDPVGAHRGRRPRRVVAKPEAAGKADVAQPGVDRIQFLLDRRHPDAERGEFRPELVDQPLDRGEVGRADARPGPRGREDLNALDPRQQPGHDHRHLVPRHRPIALERPIGITLDETLRRQRSDRVVRPVVRGHVRERLREGGSE